MKTVDLRQKSDVLKNSDILEVLLSLTPEELEKPFHIEGVNGIGHDYAAYVGPMERERYHLNASIGDKPYLERGELVVIHQNHFLTTETELFSSHPFTETRLLANWRRT